MSSYNGIMMVHLSANGKMVLLFYKNNLQASTKL